MPVAGWRLIGFLGGAMAGVLATILLLILYYDVLAIEGHGGDGLSGAATFMVLAPLLALLGGIGGALWLGRRAKGGAAGMGWIILALLLIFAVFVVLGPMLAL
jgi:hypothetical protein